MTGLIIYGIGVLIAFPVVICHMLKSYAFLTEGDDEDRFSGYILIYLGAILAAGIWPLLLMAAVATRFSRRRSAGANGQKRG